MSATKIKVKSEEEIVVINLKLKHDKDSCSAIDDGVADLDKDSCSAIDDGVADLDKDSCSAIVIDDGVVDFVDKDSCSAIVIDDGVVDFVDKGAAADNETSRNDDKVAILRDQYKLNEMLCKVPQLTRRLAGFMLLHLLGEPIQFVRPGGELVEPPSAEPIQTELNEIMVKLAFEYKRFN